MTTAYVELEIRVSQPTGLSIYWADEGQNFSERRVSHIRTFPHQHHYEILLDDIAKISRIRLDPATTRTRVILREFSLYQFGYKPIRLRTTADLGRFKPLRHIESSVASRGTLDIATSGADPQMLLQIGGAESDGKVVAFGIAWRTALVVFLGILLVRQLGGLSRDLAFVPYAMLAAFTLVFVMATVSKINAHPDEYVHLLAARYYVDHLGPPGACDEETMGTFSPYGVSRLNSTEIAYVLTGKFANLLAFLPVTLPFQLRYYNVFLFGLLLLFSIRSAPFRIVCLPLLISPQVWYIFSYANSEGTAIFVTLIGAHQLVDERSWFRRLIAGESMRFRRLKSIALGALLALAMLVKKNFYVFDLFVALWISAVAFIQRDFRIGLYTRRLASVLVVAGMLAGGWLLAHEAANDFDRTERINECRDRMASPSYLPDTPREKSHPTLYWRDKGYPFTTLFEHGWGTKVFYSAFGHFGYLELLGPRIFYKITALVLILLAAYMILTTTRRGDRLQRTTVWIGVLVFLILVVLTMWKAWTRDFQPQGRYFFPMIPVLAVVLASIRKSLSPRVLTGFVLALFALSVYYFVFVGITGIRKY